MWKQGGTLVHWLEVEKVLGSSPGRGLHVPTVSAWVPPIVQRHEYRRKREFNLIIICVTRYNQLTSVYVQGGGKRWSG